MLILHEISFIYRATITNDKLSIFIHKGLLEMMFLLMSDILADGILLCNAIRKSSIAFTPSL
jgi:hypothetical protein